MGSSIKQGVIINQIRQGNQLNICLEKNQTLKLRIRNPFNSNKINLHSEIIKSSKYCTFT